MKRWRSAAVGSLLLWARDERGTDRRLGLRECEDRGWWSDTFVGQMLFYDPADLADGDKSLIHVWRVQG